VKQALDLRDGDPMFLALRPVASVPVKPRKFHGLSTQLSILFV
jgi:hypothetical protein